MFYLSLLRSPPKIIEQLQMRYNKGHQYSFNRKLDDWAYGQQTNDFALHVMTPYGDRHLDLREDAACLLATGDNPEVLVRLPENVRLQDEMNEWVRTDKYTRRKNSGSLSASIRRILDSRSQENNNRKTRIEMTRSSCLCASFSRSVRISALSDSAVSN